MKKKVHNYELLCLFLEKEEQKKEPLVKKIQDLELEKLEVKKLETEKLFYPVEAKNYLLLHLTTSSEKTQQIEKILQQSSIQHLLINLDREKKLKIRKYNNSDISSKEKLNSNLGEEVQVTE